jgi:hypothetical protein
MRVSEPALAAMDAQILINFIAKCFALAPHCFVSDAAKMHL